VDRVRGNPGSFLLGLAKLPNAIAAELGAPVGEAPSVDAKVRLRWAKIERRAHDGLCALHGKAPPLLGS